MSAPEKVESFGREGVVPFYAKWSDGSEYWAVPAYERDIQMIGVPRMDAWPGQRVRAFHGPLFGRDLNDLHVEAI